MPSARPATAQIRFSLRLQISDAHPDKDEKLNLLQALADDKRVLSFRSDYRDKNVRIRFGLSQRLLSLTKTRKATAYFLDFLCDDRGDKQDLHEFLIREIYDHICLFVIACNLAAPGLISIDEPPAYHVNDEAFRAPHAFATDLRECLSDTPLTRKNIRLLDIWQTWQWLGKNKTFIEGELSDTNVARAIAAFCNLFSYERVYGYPTYFVWAMLGLESLYAEGNQNALSQLKGKIGLVLDLDAAETKRIGDLYNFRSRFFHGDIGLYNPHLMEKVSLRAVKQSHKEATLMAEAVTLFVGTLQYCARNKINVLKFKYVIDNA